MTAIRLQSDQEIEARLVGWGIRPTFARQKAGLCCVKVKVWRPDVATVTRVDKATGHGSPAFLKGKV